MKCSRFARAGTTPPKGRWILTWEETRLFKILNFGAVSPPVASTKAIAVSSQEVSIANILIFGYNNCYMIQPLLVFSDWGIFVLRVVLGLIMVAHGLPKVKNLKKTAESFKGMGFWPAGFWATVVAFVEFGGGLALIFGFLTQFFALLIAIQFIVILLKLKFKPEAKFKGGYEFDLLIFASALILATLGGGALSLERALGLILY